MFHVFTLQGKRIDTQLEHLPSNIRVHHVKSNNRTRKFVEGESSDQDSEKKESIRYGLEAYKEASINENEKSQIFHASEIMSSPVFTIGPDVSAEEAWQEFLDKKVHHMPVVSGDGKLIGIISDGDLSKKLISCDDGIEHDTGATVRDIMSSDVVATAPLTDIRRIAKAMLDHHLGAMPIVNDNGTIAGIITRSDILYAIIHQPGIKLWA